jgi:hypothetical protein
VRGKASPGAGGLTKDHSDGGEDLEVAEDQLGLGVKLLGVRVHGGDELVLLHDLVDVNAGAVQRRVLSHAHGLLPPRQRRAVDGGGLLDGDNRAVGAAGRGVGEEGLRADQAGDGLGAGCAEVPAAELRPRARAATHSLAAATAAAASSSWRFCQFIARRRSSGTMMTAVISMAPPDAMAEIQADLVLE